MFGIGRKARITREAQAWVVRTSNGLSSEDRTKRDQWRAADPEHENAWKRLQLIWGTTDEAARRFAATAQRRSAHSRHYGWAFACVAVVLAAGGGTFVLHRELRHGSASTKWASNQEQRHIRLADGSAADLDPDSAIRTDFSGTIRAVLLERGGARFDVAHDADHPFVVTAADRKVTAIGTRFAVALKSTGVVVTLFQGAVEVAEQAATPHHASIRMSKGQRLTVDGGAETLTPVDNIATRDPDPRDVDPTAVGTIVAIANRGATVPIRLADPALASRKIEGRFPLDDTQALAQQLAAALDLVVTQRDGTYLLSTH